MIDIYKSLGIEKLVEDQELHKRLNDAIMEDVDHVIPGYAGDYYLRTFPGEIEFEMYKDFDGRIVGTDIHFSGYDLLYMTIDNVISDDGTVHYYNVHVEGSAEAFPLRVVCPDVIPYPRAGETIFGQTVAFSGDRIRCITKEEADGGYVRDNGNGNAIIAGRIRSIAEFEFEFEDVRADFYELEVYTPIGHIAVVALKSKIPDPVMYSYISCEAMLSCDVGIKPRSFKNSPLCDDIYGDAPFKSEYMLTCGYVPNMKNAEKVLVNCMEKHSFGRFSRACAASVILHTADADVTLENSEIEKAAFPFTSYTYDGCRIMHVLSSDHNELFGWDAVVMEKSSEPVAAVAVSINKSGFVDEIWHLDPKTCVFGYDNELHALSILEHAVCNDKANMLKEFLSEKCIYRSEYADRMSIGAERFISRMNEVNGNLDDTCRYTYRIIPSSDALGTNDGLPEIYRGKWCAEDCHRGKLAAYYFIKLNEDGDISQILFSRDGKYLKEFENNSLSANEDLKHSNVRELLDDFYGGNDTLDRMRNNDTPDESEGDIYIWKESDEYVCSWLKGNGYSVTETVIEDDCIGYACTRKGKNYAVYMCACGEERTMSFDADYCQRLRTYPLSEDRKILIVYLKVEGTVGENGEKCYQVGCFSDSKEEPEMWSLENVNGRDIILYYPRPEIIDAVRRFTAAYNARDFNLLRAICTNDVVIEYPDRATGHNRAVYNCLSNMYEDYGRMKMAYVRYDDFVFSLSPYLENNLRFSFSVMKHMNRIYLIKVKQLDERVRELIITDEIPQSDPMNEYPLLSDVKFLPPDDISRFSVRLLFDNGEIRRYDFVTKNAQDDGVSPDGKTGGNDETVMIDNYCFTEKMFSHGRFAEYIGFPRGVVDRYSRRGQGISFINGYSISTAELYFNSYPVEVFCYNSMDNVFISQSDYDEDGFGVGHIGDLDPRNPLYLLDKNTMTAKAIPAEYQNTPIYISPFCGGYSEGLVMVSTMGKIDLQYHHDRYGCAGMWGWLDKELNIKISPKYVFAENFEDGRAIVCKGEWSIDGDGRYWCENEHWGVIDHDENEIVPCSFDELHRINGTSRLYAVHDGGWGDDGRNAIYDCVEHKIILTLDFDFDYSYMFNECFIMDGDILVFDEHLPGEGKDLISAYDLQAGEWLMYQQENTERTFNGEKTLTVKNKDTGKDIIVF